MMNVGGFADRLVGAGLVEDVIDGAGDLLHMPHNLRTQHCDSCVKG